MIRVFHISEKRSRTIFVCVCAKSLHSCLTLRPHGLKPARLLCPWDSPGKNAGVGCHALLQGIFPAQESNPCLLPLPHWLAGSLQLALPEKPQNHLWYQLKNFWYLLPKSKVIITFLHSHKKGFGQWKVWLLSILMISGESIVEMRRKASLCSPGGSWENCLKLALPLSLGFPCGSAGKESTCTAGVLGSIPGFGRSPGEGKGYPLQYSGLENPMNSIVHGLSKSRTQLSYFHFISFHWLSSKGPFESYKCYLFDKKNLIFHRTKGAFCKADLGILKKKINSSLSEFPPHSGTSLFVSGISSSLCHSSFEGHHRQLCCESDMVLPCLYLLPWPWALTRPAEMLTALSGAQLYTLLQIKFHCQPFTSVSLLVGISTRSGSKHSAVARALWGPLHPFVLCRLSMG